MNTRPCTKETTRRPQKNGTNGPSWLDEKWFCATNARLRSVGATALAISGNPAFSRSRPDAADYYCTLPLLLLLICILFIDRTTDAHTPRILFTVFKNTTLGGCVFRITSQTEHVHSRWATFHFCLFRWSTRIAEGFFTGSGRIRKGLRASERARRENEREFAPERKCRLLV